MFWQSQYNKLSEDSKKLNQAEDILDGVSKMILCALETTQPNHYPPYVRKFSSLRDPSVLGSGVTLKSLVETVARCWTESAPKISPGIMLHFKRTNDAYRTVTVMISATLQPTGLPGTVGDRLIQSFAKDEMVDQLTILSMGSDRRTFHILADREHHRQFITLKPVLHSGLDDEEQNTFRQDCRHFSRVFYDVAGYGKPVQMRTRSSPESEWVVVENVDPKSL